MLLQSITNNITNIISKHLTSHPSILNARQLKKMDKESKLKPHSKLLQRVRFLTLETGLYFEWEADERSRPPPVHVVEQSNTPLQWLSNRCLSLSSPRFVVFVNWWKKQSTGRAAPRRHVLVKLWCSWRVNGSCGLCCTLSRHVFQKGE